MFRRPGGPGRLPRVVPVATVAVVSALGMVSLGGVAAAAAPVPGVLSVLAGTGTAGRPTPGPAGRSDLDNPAGSAIDGLGNVYIADTRNDEVEKVTSAGVLSIIAGTGVAAAPTPGPATSSALDLPTGVAVDRLGDVFVADSGNDEVEEVTAKGVLSIVAGTGTAGRPTAGPATSSALDNPSGVAVDGLGDIYIADAGNDEVDKVTTSGDLSVIAGTGAAGTPTAGRATGSELHSPSGVAVDGLGDVFVADTVNNEIEKVSGAGVLSLVAGTGTAGKPTPGPATSSDLDHPYGIGVDAVGDLYVADTLNQEVDEVSSTGSLSVVAGTGTAGAPAPGPATSSDLGRPTSVAVDGTGNLYVPNADDDDVVKVTGAVTTTVGVAAAPTEGGYVDATSAGNVHNVGTPFHGSPRTAGVTLASPVTAVATTSNGGYLVATAAGSVYNYGTTFEGSPRAAGVTLTSPIVGISASPGGGYVLATAAGSVYNYGTTFEGSPRADGVTLSSPIVGISATPSDGYDLASADGNVYDYHASFAGSPVFDGVTLPSAIVGMAATPGHGYLVASATGNVYNYQTAFSGSPRGSQVVLADPIAGIAACDSHGYFVVTSAGLIYAYDT